jgi:hypothetical protein
LQRIASLKRRIARDRATAKRLAERLGVTLEQDTGLELPYPWYVSHPTLEGEADPYEGDHYAYNWSEVLERVRGYEAALKAAAQ